MRLYALFFSIERKIRRSTEDTKVSVTLYRICSFMRLHVLSAQYRGYTIGFARISFLTT